MRAMILLPGATIGILGGGQLGRMTAMAARTLGYQVHALDPDPACPARAVVDRCVTAAFDDADAAADLASRCDVVTLEIERVAIASLRAAQARCPVRPGPETLAIVQDRGHQRAWLRAHGAPQGPWMYAETGHALREALTALGGDCFVKSCRDGYDGRGQFRARTVDDAAAAWEALGGAPCVAERALDLEAEVSVMVARSPSGATAVYPPALNHHEDRVLDWSVLPAALPAGVLSRASVIARDIASAMGLEGIVAVELFLTRGGELLVNELAPRPHNSFHATTAACATSQFEQHVRAVCNLPLGSTALLRPAAIVNLLGDLWTFGSPRFDRALAIPGVSLHLYGKRDARPGRKMGHLTAAGATTSEAIAKAKAAREVLRG